ncbi:FxSxx-COOH cyclophane-containing RiPP peptide [Streptomyces sp. NPDC048282]|uniref:FxSxx-COOH cyclophane-containing RiPP peptide n=1 Tax=unclassified Streptomyces TaxID=2593676 RepID=UPI00371118FD
METSATGVEIDFDVVNLSGSADVRMDLDELPESALGRSIRRVRRDTLEHRAVDVSIFQSAL